VAQPSEHRASIRDTNPSNRDRTIPRRLPGRTARFAELGFDMFRVQDGKIAEHWDAD
jgi:hypothetical protein